MNLSHEEQIKDKMFQPELETFNKIKFIWLPGNTVIYLTSYFPPDPKWPFYV